MDWFTFTLTQQTRVVIRGSSRIEGELLDSGGQSTPEAPVLISVQPGTDLLNVFWMAPDYTGTSDITGYDVRHIPSGASNKANDSAWTVIPGATPGAGQGRTLSYAIAGLSDGLRRDVQVRAVNSRGDGDWSVTGRGKPGAVNRQGLFVRPVAVLS